MFRVCHAFLSAHCSLVVTCGEIANLMALLCVVFHCVFVPFPCGVLGQLWYLIYRFLIFAYLLWNNTVLDADLISTGAASPLIKRRYNPSCTTLTNFSTKYLVMCKVFTDVGGIKYIYHVCPPVRKIIHSLKLVDYLHVQADNPWYNPSCSLGRTLVSSSSDSLNCEHFFCFVLS